MAYFDSAKNRALWQKELNELRKERSQRELSGFAGGTKKKANGLAEHPGRVRITYAELEREEYEAVRSRASEKAGREKEASVESSGREREAEAAL